jgi:Bacterial CdiA-CT RNAse A domain
LKILFPRPGLGLAQAAGPCAHPGAPRLGEILGQRILPRAFREAKMRYRRHGQTGRLHAGKARPDRAPVNQSRPPVPPTQARPAPQRDDFRAPPAQVPGKPHPLRIGKGLANDNAPSPVPPPGPIAVGRGPMKGAAKPSGRDVGFGERLQEMAQDANDATRLIAEGVTIGGADHVAAAGNALGSLLSGGDYTEAYRKNLAEELAKTEEARKRLGVAGALAEAAPTALPVIGDAVGLLGDIKYYKENPEELTPGSAALSALGIVPGFPALAGTVKRVDDALDAAEGGIKKADDALSPARLPFDEADPKAVEKYYRRPIEGNEGETGHVIAKHVGKTEQELLARYKSEPRIPASSSFPDLVTAERVIHDTLIANDQKIRAWLKDGDASNALPLYYSASDVIGISVLKDGTVLKRTGASTVLKKSPDGGFYYHTAYPE